MPKARKPKRGTVAAAAPASRRGCRWRRSAGGGRRKGLRILLITSRDTGRWVIPKGWPMRNRSDAEAAAREAYEEAGLRGVVAERSIGLYTYQKTLAPKRAGARSRCGSSRSRCARWCASTPRPASAGSSGSAREAAARRVAEPELKALIRDFDPGPPTDDVAARRRERLGLPAGAGGATALDLDRLTDGLFRRLEDALDELGGALFEPVVRLGVTGLSRAGKTVFITSLVANLLDRGRMPQLRAAAEGRILAAYLQPQPDHTIPRFAYEDHLAALTAPRAALAREHPLDLDPAPVAAGRPDRPARRPHRPARRASRHRRLPRRVAARPAADEPGLRRLVRRRHRHRPHPGARAARRGLARRSSTPPTPPRPLDEADRPRPRRRLHRLPRRRPRRRPLQRRAGPLPDAGRPRGLARAHLLAAAAPARAARRPRSGAPSSSASRPTSASSSSRSSATTSPASTARSC